ncbi:GNAT family N-acetyltransferase [Enterococcus nangangensis]|uniref:GNAT family N-acetyltransferase n=1 Tax=Enterococcus nangangensis TaxID=2559926 RepID=UPI0010F53199|nr:GNAT family N-acetyltransferase [Enterococcus nangangensis]
MKIVQTKDTLSDIYVDALRIRHDVFMVEQNVPLEEEIDQDEAYCIHFVAYNDDKVPMGTCRLHPLQDGVMKLQRMAVQKKFRKMHIGEQLILEAEAFAKEQHYHHIILGAQLTAQPFYAKLGYQAYGEEFLDANIPHIMMEKYLD